MQEGESSVTLTVGHPRVMGIPIPKTLVIWVSPVTQTLTQIAKIIREGDAHITVTAAIFPSETVTFRVSLYLNLEITALVPMINERYIPLYCLQEMALTLPQRSATCMFLLTC